MEYISTSKWWYTRGCNSNRYVFAQLYCFQLITPCLFSGGLDLIIIPGLGFTTNGKRLGRGKGYYDKYIIDYKKKYLCNDLKTIGLAFSQQICDEIPTTEQDSLIDFIIYP